MNINDANKVDVVDCVLLIVLAMVGGLLAFHPYYFGDEILPFFFSFEHGATFWSVYANLNQYKPRLIFNAIWAIAATQHAPRYDLMLLTTGAIGAVAVIVYHLARVQFSASRTIALIGGFAIISSRFSIVSYYDYIAGTIESLSALCFFGALVLIMAPKVCSQLNGIWRVMLALAGCVAAVFIHERYIAGSMALGGVLIVRSINIKRRSLDLRAFGYGVLFIVLPTLLFATATTLFSTLPLLTGTNGKGVSLSFGILERAVIYAGNVFFGMNNGHPWLVGSLQFSGAWDTVIILTLVALFALVYIYVATLGRKEVSWRQVIEILILISSLILVASLPDSSRQEGRWMTPVLALTVFLGLSLGRARSAYLVLLIAMNFLYLAAGSQFQIYNIESSKMASTIASPLNRLRLQGRRGIVLNAPDNGAQWALGGYGGFGNDGTSGVVFSKLNFASKVQVDPGVSKSSEHDFGLYYLGPGTDNDSVFSYIGHRELALLQDPSKITPESGDVIGGRGRWGTWQWNKAKALIDSDGVELHSGDVGTLTVPVSNLVGNLIVYRARALSRNLVPMRIQINWLDEKGRFLGAFIKVVSVGEVAENFAAVVDAPRGASEGMVYANLHDGANGVVELESIRLIGH